MKLIVTWVLKYYRNINGNELDTNVACMIEYIKHTSRILILINDKRGRGYQFSRMINWSKLLVKWCSENGYKLFNNL